MFKDNELMMDIFFLGHNEDNLKKNPKKKYPLWTLQDVDYFLKYNE